MFPDAGATEKDVGAAVAWYRRAADSGYAKAQDSLGRRYAFGQGVAADSVQALFWTMLAANQGLERAQTNRDELKARMSGEDITRAEKLVADWKRAAD